MDELVKSLLVDLRAAQKMIDQAMSRVHPSTDVFKAIKTVDEDLDSIVEGLEEGDFEQVKARK